jgi:integrase
MAGHVEDRWYRDKRDEATGEVIVNAKGKPVQEPTELCGKGMRYRVRYYDDANKERSKSFPDNALGKAQKFLVKMQHDVMAGEYVSETAGKLTLKAYAELWLKGQSQDAHTQQTVRRRLTGQVYPLLGDRTLSRVARTDVAREWLAWLKDERGLAASYRAVLFDLLSSILTAAVDDKRIRQNPLRAKSIQRPRPEARKVVPWARTRVERVEDALPESYRLVVPMGAGLGLRQGEIFGASEDDFDRDTQMFTVARQIRWIGTTPVFAPPKGGKTRQVPVSAAVLGEVDDWVEAGRGMTVTLPWLEPGGDPITVRVLIDFTQDRGQSPRANEPWFGGTFTQSIWKDAVEAAGGGYVKRRDGMHALRHFFASHLLAQGVSIKELAEYLGHFDPGYTLKIYTHLVASSHTRARLAIDGAFGGRWGRADQDHGLRTA